MGRSEGDRFFFQTVFDSGNETGNIIANFQLCQKICFVDAKKYIIKYALQVHERPDMISSANRL